MAKVDGTFYSGSKGRPGTTPQSSPDLEGVQPYPINPPGSSPNQTPPVDIRYTSDTAMFAGQANQKSGFLYFDGTNTYWYLGTVNGDITDYKEFGGGGGGLTGSGNANEIAYFTGATALSSLPVATYPNLTELSYVKGVTSGIQSQLGTKISEAPNDGLSYIRKNLSWVYSKSYNFGSLTTGSANIIDSLGNVTYTTTYSNISVVTHSLINLKIMTVNLYGISSTGSPSGGNLLIQASGDNTFLGLNVDNSKAVITVTRLSGTSYSSADISLYFCQIITIGGVVSLSFKNIATNTIIPAFTSTNASIELKILSYD